MRDTQTNSVPRPTIKLKLNRPPNSGIQPDRSGSSSHLGLSFSGQDRKVNGTGYGDHDPSNGNVEHGLTPLASTPSTNVNGVGFPMSMMDARSEVSQEVLGTPKGTPVIPAPVKLDASIQGSPSRSTSMTTPMTSFRTPSPSKGIDSFQGDKTAESALSTPQISREIYRATHEQNGTIPSIAGLSPTKHSPPRPIDSASSNRYKAATPILPPVALSPSPQHQILTPPIKPSEPPRPFENR